MRVKYGEGKDVLGEQPPTARHCRREGGKVEHTIIREMKLRFFLPAPMGGSRSLCVYC